MWLEHIIPADRLRKSYFRRWFYWRGVSRALLYERAGLDMESPERPGHDPSTVPHIAGVPRYLYRKALREVVRWVRDTVRRDPVGTFQHETWLWFFSGIVRQRWKDSQMQSRAVPAAGQRG